MLPERAFIDFWGAADCRGLIQFDGLSGLASKNEEIEAEMKRYQNLEIKKFWLFL